MKKTILTVAALALALVFAAVSQTPRNPKHHVVFQLTEPDGAAWCVLALHLTNMRNAFAQDGGSQVDTGVAELARKQEAGWAYIHWNEAVLRRFGLSLIREVDPGHAVRRIASITERPAVLWSFAGVPCKNP